MSTEYKTGTTTLGLIYSKGVVLAADRRVTAIGEAMALIASKNIRKIEKITDYLAITVAGSVADVEQLAKILRAQIALYENRSGKKMDIRSIANLFSTIVFQNRLYLIPSEFILGGYDDKPRLFIADTAGTFLEENKYAFTGSGSLYAVGVLDAEYKENMKEEEAVNLALKAINSAFSRDPYSGEGIDVAIVDAKGVRFLSEEEINKITKAARE
jgi:proteasome beta subunit